MDHAITTITDQPMPSGVIRRCKAADVEAICAVINEAAQAYRGVIPEDRWTDPYMPAAELHHEIDGGVRFWGSFDDDVLVGVMGLQDVADVALIRHAYTRTGQQGRGVGAALLAALEHQTPRPILIGTWRAATWAIRFYEKHGFRLVDEHQKDELLRRYWEIPTRQVEESVVLASARWRGTM